MQATNADHRMDCENCGHQGLRPFIDKPGHRLLFCPTCLLYQKGMMPEETLYENVYHNDYSKRRRNKVITARIRLGALTHFMDSTRPATSPKMLDIGCSVGATVEAGNQMGWQSTGVDISGEAVALCRDRGLDCHKIAGTELPFEDNRFDVVTNWHVIEHVADVKATLNEWFRVVRPGGIMVLETPESQCLKARRLGAGYTKFWPREHLYTFTRSNMSSLLEQSGFEILPSRIIGRFSSLPPHLTAYSAAYRSLRKVYRALGVCKSIEVCCRKPTTTIRLPKKNPFAADRARVAIRS